VDARHKAGHDEQGAIDALADPLLLFGQRKQQPGRKS
jgi:hypothetical protein